MAGHMPVTHLCPRCPTIHANIGPCPQCQARLDAEHNAQPYRKGYATRAYRRARTVALAMTDECETCGTMGEERDPTTGRKTNPLTIDHIDKNTMHNEPDNLRVLCLRCNSARR